MNYINNWLTRLTGELLVGADELPVPSDALGRLVIAEGSVYALTITDSINPAGQATFEIFHVVGTGPGTYILLRGREGTVEADWPTDSYVYCSVTAGGLSELRDLVSDIDQRVSALEAAGGGVSAWQVLAVGDGWDASEASPPAARLTGDTVELRGELFYSDTTENDQPLTLPEGLRPVWPEGYSADIFCPVVVFASVSNRAVSSVRIDSDGGARVVLGDVVSRQYLCLDGVRFSINR
ncbi:hypothetical protein QM298_13985 [Pseudomonas mendocina]|nr:hypothetical protein [Pseudomonas mendocina]MDV5861988.1 hypothetical protein [Pseudomonas mendocina]